MMSANEEHVRKALDLAADEEWEAARSALDGIAGEEVEHVRTFLTRMLSRDRARRDARLTTRHELANAITIAIANLEGMIDGAVTVTPKRLQNVCEALRRAQGLMG